MISGLFAESDLQLKAFYPISGFFAESAKEPYN